MRLRNNFLFLCLAISGFAACSAQGIDESGVALAHATLTTAEVVAGFESTTAWSVASGAATLGLSDDHVQGSKALSVSNVNGYAAIRSDLTQAPTTLDNTISLQIRPTAGHARQSWKGQVQLFVDSPSRGLYGQFVGQAGLEALSEGQFGKVSFSVPVHIRSALTAGTISDVRYTLALNVPLRGPYLLDALQFAAAPPAFQLKAYVGGRDVALVWDVGAPSSNANYEVLRDGQVITARSGGPSSGTPNTFIDEDVVEGQTYTYQVRAVSSSGTRASQPLVVTHSSQGTPVPSISIDALEIYVRKPGAPAKTPEEKQHAAEGLLAGKRFLETWYPKIANIIAQPAHQAAVEIGIRGTSDCGNAGWVGGDPVVNVCENYAHDMGLYVHEATHIIQADYLGHSRPPGIPESIASWAGNLALGRANTRPSAYMSFYDDYEYGAYFYDWVAQTYNRPNFVREINQASYLGQYDGSWYANTLGRSLGQLWGEMAQDGFTSPGPLQNAAGYYVYPKDKGDENDTSSVGLRIRHSPPDNPGRFYQGQISNGQGLLRWEKDYCFGEDAQHGVVLQDCGVSADKWRFEAGAFINARTGRCLQAQAGSNADQTPIVTEACTGSAEQRWLPLPI